MGDGADLVFDYMDHLDEAYLRGDVDEETGQEVQSPFQYKQKPHGPGPCPVCKEPTVEMVGRYGTFYGCPNFPECNGRRGA
jgi:hypothetical protein